jgi:hypothetical protein
MTVMNGHFRNASFINVRARDYVTQLVNLFEDEDLHDVMVVGHSLAGVWLQLLLEEVNLHPNLHVNLH